MSQSTNHMTTDRVTISIQESTGVLNYDTHCHPWNLEQVQLVYGAHHVTELTDLEGYAMYLVYIWPDSAPRWAVFTYEGVDHCEEC